MGVLAIKAVFFDLGDTLIVEENHGGKHLREAELKKVPHVDRVLRKLKGRYKLGVITNTVTSREEDVRLALRKLGIEHYFDVVVTSVDVGVKKPGEKIFLAALKAAGVKPSEAVMVGNRISTDVIGGNRVGMMTVLLKWRERYHEKAASQMGQPTRVIRSLEELPNVLTELADRAL